MKITKKLRKAKGFTLVELLIVIIIIGILAGMMMLATGAATDKAEATKVVSNMRNIKAAAVMAYADGLTWAEVVANDASVDKYLDQKLLSATSPIYALDDAGSDDIVVQYLVTEGGIYDKLVEMMNAGDSALSDDGTYIVMPVN